jgi:hypothetical protein
MSSRSPPRLFLTNQQPTKEQLAKLFEVMRLRQQLQSYLKMMPAMIQQQIQSAVQRSDFEVSGANLDYARATGPT